MAFRAGTLTTQANYDVDMYVNFKQAAAFQERIKGINLLMHTEPGKKKAGEQYRNRPPLGFCCSVRQIILR